MAGSPQNNAQLQTLIEAVPWTNNQGLISGQEVHNLFTATNTLIGNVSDNAVAVNTYATPGVGDQTAQIGAAVAVWNGLTATTFGQRNPAITAQPLVFTSGVWSATNLTITTSGTGAAITGDGVTSQLQGISILVQDFDNDIKGLNLLGPGSGVAGTYAIRYAGNNRRFSLLQDTWISQFGTGLIYDYSGGSDDVVNVQITYCGTGLQVLNTFGTAFTNIDMLAIVNIGFDLQKIGEVKMVNCRCVGSNTPLWIHGSSATTAVESYFGDSTFTNANRISLPISATVSNGGFAQVTLATKIAVTFSDVGNIFINGAPGVSATCRLGYGTSNPISSLTTGNLTSVIANGVQLISGPVAFSTNFNVFASAIGAAINANTATTGYSTNVVSSAIYILAPVALGAAANGLLVTSTVTGDLTDSSGHYVALNYATPHGLSLGQDAWFDGGTQGSANFFYGQHAIRYIPSPTVAVSEIKYTGAYTGMAWVLPRLAAGRPYAQIEYTNAGLYTIIQTTISAVDDTTATINYPIADLPTSTWTGPVITVPGWDTVLETIDTGTTHGVQDMFFTGGNTNAVLCKSAYDINFVGMRLKDFVWIDYRANKAFRSARINFTRQGRGRTNDPAAPGGVFTNVVIAGAYTGFTDVVDGDDTGNSFPGGGYKTIRTPNNLLPLVAWVPQTNELRVTETDVEMRVGPQTVSLTANALTVPVNIINPQITTVNKLEFKRGTNIIATNASPPTVTYSAAYTGAAGGTSAIFGGKLIPAFIDSVGTFNFASFRLYGPTPSYVAGTPSAAQPQNGSNTSATQYTGGYYRNAYEFEYYGTALEIPIYNDTTGYGFQILVDGLVLTPTVSGNFVADNIATANPTDTGKFCNVTLTWGSAGSHTIKIIMCRTACFGGVTIGPQDYLVASSNPSGPQILMVTDNFGDGNPSGLGYNVTTYGLDTYPNQLANLLGVPDLWLDSQGGTGYINNAGGGAKATFLARLQNAASTFSQGTLPQWRRLNPQIVIVPASVNDGALITAGTYTQAQLIAQVQACVAFIRTTWPLAYVVLTGELALFSSLFWTSGDLANEAGVLSCSNLADLYIDAVSGVWIGSNKLNTNSYSGSGTFVGPLNNVTSYVLSAAFVGATGTYKLLFGDGTVIQNVSLTNGSTGASWSVATTTTTASFNYVLQLGGSWFTGKGYYSSPYTGTFTFTGALVAATSATLTAGFTGGTGSNYSIKFSDGSVRTGIPLTNGSTAVSWTGAVTATANAAFTYPGTVAGNADVMRGNSPYPTALGHSSIATAMMRYILAALGLDT